MLCKGKTSVEHFSICYKFIMRTCYGLEVECREEVSCCSGAWLVIQLGGGAEQTVELLPSYGWEELILQVRFPLDSSSYCRFFFSSKYLLYYELVCTLYWFEV